MRNLIFFLLLCVDLVQGQTWNLIDHYNYVITDIHYTDEGNEWVTQQQGQVLLNGDTVATFPTQFNSELGLLAIETYQGKVIINISGTDYIQRVIMWDTSTNIMDTLIEVDYTIPLSSNHVGGDLVVLDSILYCSFGDGQRPNSAQHSLDLRGKIVKVDLENMAMSIWAKGFRNPFRMAVNDTLFEIWVADVGDTLVEEVSIVELNDNGGWPCWEGSYEVDTGCMGMILMPVLEYYQQAPRAIIGGAFLNNEYYWTDHWSGGGGSIDLLGNNTILSYPTFVTSMDVNPVTNSLIVATWNGDLFEFVPDTIPLSIDTNGWYKDYIDIIKGYLSEVGYEEWLDYLQESYFPGINYISVDGKEYKNIPDIAGYYFDMRHRKWIFVNGSYK